jgi:hypothetical protein
MTSVFRSLIPTLLARSLARSANREDLNSCEFARILLGQLTAMVLGPVPSTIDRRED